MKGKMLLCCVLSVFTSILKAQTVKKISITLKDTVLSSDVKLPMVIDFATNCKDDYNSFKGLPDTRKDFKIKDYELKKFFPRPQKGNPKIYMLVTGNKNNYKIKVDKNFNKDFSDDSVLTKSEIKNGFSFSITIGNTIYVKRIRLFPFYNKMRWGDADEQKWQMGLTPWPCYKHAELKVGLASKDIYFLNISLSNTWNKNSIVYYTEDYDARDNPEERFTFQDSLNFFHNNFILDSIDPEGNTAWFYEVPHGSKCGYNTGDSLCIADTFLLSNNEPFRFNFPKHRYTLIHFWGTWCGPCITELPILSELVGKNKGKVECLNIAYEENIDFKKLDTLYSKYPFLANDIVIQEPSPFAENNTVVRKLKVSVFPTYFLVDKNGIIILRTTNQKGLNAIQGLLKKISENL